MIYLYYMMVASTGILPIAVPLVFIGAVFVQQTSAFWLNRPLGQTRRVLPLPKSPGDTSAVGRARLRRWHIAASIFVLGAPALAMASNLVSQNELAGCSPGELYGCVVTGALTEVMLALLLGSVAFALLYLNILFRNGVADAALIAFGVWAMLRSLLLLTPQFAEATYTAFDAAMVVGVLMFGATIWLRSGRWRTVAFATSCAMMTVGLVSASMSNGVLFVTDGVLSASAIGYGIYLMQRRRIRASDGVIPGSASDLGIANAVRSLQFAVSAILLAMMAAATAILLAASPEASDASSMASVGSIGWQTSWLTLGCLSAVLVAVITLTRWKLELRPFLLGMMWPALIMLAAGNGLIGTPELRLGPQQLAGAALTAGLLWAMWYVYGPTARCRDAS